MQMLVDLVADCLPQFPRLPAMFAATFANTFATSLRPQPDGSTFVLTGDIPAMWLRDSAAQVRPYLRLAAQDEALAALIAGVVARQGGAGADRPLCQRLQRGRQCPLPQPRQDRDGAMDMGAEV